MQSSNETLRDSLCLLGLEAEEFKRELGAFLDELGHPPYRLRQIRTWLYARTPADFAGMSDLPKDLRERLAQRYAIHALALVSRRVSRDGTRKYLWRTRRGDAVESVLIPERDRVTYCLSTQAGCPVRCTFCATGYGGFAGQLEAEEIIDQFALQRLVSSTPPTNIVFMGMGEPLLNFENLRRALRILTHPAQFALGDRRITVSTVGVPDRIRTLAREFPQVKLALSLHASRNELRDVLVPLNRRYPLGAVLESVREHTRLTGKKVTFEYVVLPGVNDTLRDARETAALVAGIPSRINLIGFNPFPGAPYRKPGVPRLERFRAWLKEHYPGPVTIRRSRGEDIEGACGQLSLVHAREEG